MSDSRSDAGTAGERFQQLVGIMRTLRSEHGCACEQEQPGGGLGQEHRPGLALEVRIEAATDDGEPVGGDAGRLLEDPVRQVEPVVFDQHGA